MTALAEKSKTLTVEEYLEFEKSSRIRHEYVDGTLLAMAGEKKRHNRIASKIMRLLADIAETKGCQVFIEGIKLRTRDTRYRYPDVIVTCEEDSDEYLVFNPCALFEVISDSTEHTDTEAKVEEYLKLSSLESYVLLRQDRKIATVYKRDETGWRIEFLEDVGEIEIPCLKSIITLEQIYAGLEFETKTQV